MSILLKLRGYGCRVACTHVISS